MSPLSVSPLAPARFPVLPSVAGFEIATFAAGIKYQNRADLLLVQMAEGTSVAGTLTKSMCPSAPVDWCRRLLPAGRARCLVVNSGNANAFTGSAGETATDLTATTIAGELGISPDEVFLASTGVIGESLPSDTLVNGVVSLSKRLVGSGPTSWEQAANAIRTTDTYAKGSAVTTAIGDIEVKVVGIGKGSGMIAPDMATMLCFVFTDASVTAEVLQAMVSGAVEASYNRITVDSDTSTSDTVLVFASGRAGNETITDINDPALDGLKAAMQQINLDLAHQIVRDGEGATKFIRIDVSGAESASAAKTIGLSIANSPLVKTAMGAADANWGRIVMAVGKAGQKANRDRLSIWIGDEQCASEGKMMDGYDEAKATEHLMGDEVRISVDVGVGEGSSTVWTCDLTHEYVTINADYRS